MGKTTSAPFAGQGKSCKADRNNLPSVGDQRPCQDILDRLSQTRTVALYGALAGRDDILVFELNDFHLSLGILFIGFFLLSVESLCEAAVALRTQRVNSPGEVLHQSALFSAMRCRFFCWTLTGYSLYSARSSSKHSFCSAHFFRRIHSG